MKKLLLLIALLVVGCAHQTPTMTGVETAKVEYPEKILDAHAHFEEGEFQGTDPDLNVMGAVVHLDLAEFRNLKKRKPTVMPMALCAPARPGVDVAAVEKALADRACKCIKVYLGYVPKWASDSFYKPFYRMAEKHNVPVVFHTGDTYDKMAKVKYADPLTVDEIAVTYPKVKFVLAHMGNPWFQSAAEVVYKNDNVYVDTSALLLDDVSKLSPEVVEEMMTKPIRWFFAYVENPKKFLYGSDWPLVNQKAYVRAIQNAIPREHWGKVFYSNAATLFSFEKEPGLHQMISLKRP